MDKKHIYKNIIDYEDFGIWEWNLYENSIFLSDKCFEIVNSDVTKFRSLYEFVEKFSISEDKFSAKNDIEIYLNGNNSKYRSEFTVIDKERNKRLILIKGKSLEKNKKVICGTMYNLTFRKRLEDDIKTLAYFDSLTELPNRNLFSYDFKEILDKRKISKKDGALIFIDIDNFKQVNDIFGHDHGDFLLKVFSQILDIITEKYGKAYRLSGDEFIILVEKASKKKEIEDICIELLDAFKESFEVKDKQINISISIGVTMFPKDSDDKNILQKYIDLAMYYSKNTGKNKYTFFDEKIHNEYTRNLDILQELKNAIKNDELYVVYQPQVDMKNNIVIGFEALLRWENKKIGNINPSEFIPLAEKNGLILDIGDWVIETVCKKIKELIAKGYNVSTISVNVSPIQFKKDSFLKFLKSVCEKNEVDHKLIELEITERTLIDLYKDNINFIDKLIQSGFKIAIDDFGTGYSSLNYLTMIQINKLKIDKSFIDNIYNKKNQAVVKCILDLSKTLEYEVIAEGVEEKLQLDKLINLGCNRIQGYYFSKPVSEYEMEKYLDKR